MALATMFTAPESPAAFFRVKHSCFFQRGAEPCAVSRVLEARTRLGLQQLPGNEAPSFLSVLASGGCRKRFFFGGDTD